LLPFGSSSALKAFLTCNSFIYIENDVMLKAVFKDETKEEEEEISIQSLLYKARNMNVMKTTVFHFDDNNKLSEYSFKKMYTA
jgi:hypothetical protein